jgi:hypothetical protein
MIIVQLLGGLGNQMFQYAIGRRLAWERNTSLKLDITHYQQDPLRRYGLHQFNIQAEVASLDELNPILNSSTGRKAIRWLERRFFPFTARSTLHERYPYQYDSDVPRCSRRTIYLQGYWQNEAYFKPIERLIREDFTWRNALNPASHEIARQIREVISVSLHIRRGDYAHNPVTQRFHGLLPMEYYVQASEHIAAQVGKPHFFVFSDDPQWAEENLRLRYPLTFIRHNGGNSDQEDLRLMSLCQHHIIANSSFSWWGAWLSDNPNKIVFAPCKWLNNPILDTTYVTPSGWHRI